MASLNYEDLLRAREIHQAQWKLAVAAFILVPVVGALTFFILHLTIGVGTWLAVLLGLIFGSLWILAAWILNYVRRTKRLLE